MTDVGVADGDPNQQFSRVSHALRLSDGTLLVADGQANEIRAFDAQGPFLRKMGRSGGGPGDTVAAYDCMAGRLSFFGPGDAFARDVFDAEGRLLGAVAKPTGLRVTQIGADFIVGTWRDELEVPHVRVYRLEKWAAR